MEPTAAFAQLQLGFVDQIQWRYEAIRPLVLFADRTVTQRAEEMATHPDTVRTLRRRFQQQGMLGLMPATPEVTPRSRATQGAYRAQADRANARLQIVRRYYQGWDKVSLSRFMQISRPTIDRWIARFETEYFAGLADRKRGPQWPRKVWFPVMVAVSHLQKRHPNAGEFRIWSLLARPDLSVRTVGRIMALNERVYEDIPHVRRPGPQPPPQPHPYKARRPHECWFIDGRMMDFALEGVRWWSLSILEGYSRTMLARMIAPTEATWVALMVLYTACLRYGAPEQLVSDSGGAYTSHDQPLWLCHLALLPLLCGTGVADHAGVALALGRPVAGRLRQRGGRGVSLPLRLAEPQCHRYPGRRVLPHALRLIARCIDAHHPPRLSGALSPAVWKTSQASDCLCSAVTAL